MQAFELSSSWDVRTYLSESEAKEWAATAAVESALANDDGGSGSDEAHRCGVFVVLFSDGDISSCTDPNTGEAGFADWSFDVIKKVRPSSPTPNFPTPGPWPCPSSQPHPCVLCQAQALSRSRS